MYIYVKYTWDFPFGKFIGINNGIFHLPPRARSLSLSPSLAFVPALAPSSSAVFNNTLLELNQVSI